MIYLLHQALDQSAKKYPDKDAIRFQGKSLTYSELAQRSNQLANFLQSQSVQKGDRIGVFLNKGFESAIAIYGIMKTGAAYVPLDPKSPTQRLISIIEDCGLQGIITENNKKTILSEVSQAQDILKFIIGINDVPHIKSFAWDDVHTMPDELQNPVAMVEQDLAYIMYTSGTTGKPKGIMHSHYSGLAYARMSAATYDVTPDDRLGNFAPLHFDISTFGYLTNFFVGATVIEIPEAYTLFPANLSKLTQDEKMTIWYSVPFALIQLVTRGVIEQRDLSSLRWILYGGEPFPSSHMRTLMQALPNAQISNVYGPAEVNQCTYFTIPSPDTWDSDDYRIPLGYMSYNAIGLIIDDNDEEVAEGEIGELVVRTGTMMSGYWGRPDLNRKAFFRIQRFPDFEEIYYRTGDLVYMREDGLLDFMGRKDHQVKVRGFRVELSEVDTVLNTFDAVEEASSFVIKSEEGDQIWAAVTLLDNMTLDEGKLLSHANKNLPHYAVPRRILIKDSFPRGGTGKIDRNALQQEAQLEQESSQ